MNDATVRIEGIEIRNFKNINRGSLDFDDPPKGHMSSVLGLYGQNGSGKTALIDALELLKFALSGRAVPSSFADYINVDSSFASLKFKFKVRKLTENSSYSVIYEFSLRRDINNAEHNTDSPAEVNTYKVTLFNEILSYSYKSGGKMSRKSHLIDTSTENDVAFTPVTKYKTLVGNDKKNTTDMIVIKQLVQASSRSFIFSRELVNKIRQNCKEPQYRFLIESLVYFGNFELFVINTKNTALISMNTLPLTFNYTENKKLAIGTVLISLNISHPFLIPEEKLAVVNSVINNMNIVLKQLVPGLTINIKDLGTELNQNGNLEHRIVLMSNKNSEEIPLQHESEGIKKIVSILQLLIVVYNNSSFTVAIDELDSGVFEYLLGELLHIIAEKGKGQLIFTSHNLRPLERLDKSCIAFTTTNPDNRFIRMTKIKPSNNLRNSYFRDIILNEQSEVMYEPTNNSEIAMAFKEAWLYHAE